MQIDLEDVIEYLKHRRKLRLNEMDGIDSSTNNEYYINDECAREIQACINGLKAMMKRLEKYEKPEQQGHQPSPKELETYLL